MSRVLITGVSRGIGEGLLKRSLESGHECAALDRRGGEGDS